MASSEENTATRAKKIVEGARKNSESIGASAAVIATWLLETYTSTAPPGTVVMAVGTLVGGYAARLKDRL